MFDAFDRSNDPPPPLSTCAIHTIFPMNLHFSPFFSWLFSTKNQRYYDSLGGVIIRISLNMCTLSKDQSILSRETIQFFFKELCPFFKLRLFILYQASRSRALAPACGALEFFCNKQEHQITFSLFLFWTIPD